MNDWRYFLQPEVLISAVIWVLIGLAAVSWACSCAHTGSGLDRPWSKNPRLY